MRLQIRIDIVNKLNALNKEYGFHELCNKLLCSNTSLYDWLKYRHYPQKKFVDKIESLYKEYLTKPIIPKVPLKAACKDIPIMPKEYIGATFKGRKGFARRWTAEEEKWVNNMRELGYTYKDISFSVQRSLRSVEYKLQIRAKAANTYNIKHVDEKYSINNDFVAETRANSVLDLYCGQSSFYMNHLTDNNKKLVNFVTTNDINKNYVADYHEEAERVAYVLWANRIEYDIVDLDPFGGAYDCIRPAIRLAKKGLIVSFGELCYKRYGLPGIIKKFYDIHTIKDFTLDNMIRHVQEIGLYYGKKLTVYKARQWNGRFARVWFTVEPFGNNSPALRLFDYPYKAMSKVQ